MDDGSLLELSSKHIKTPADIIQEMLLSERQLLLLKELLSLIELDVLFKKAKEVMEEKGIM